MAPALSGHSSAVPLHSRLRSSTARNDERLEPQVGTEDMRSGTRPAGDKLDASSSCAGSAGEQADAILTNQDSLQRRSSVGLNRRQQQADQDSVDLVAVLIS